MTEYGKIVSAVDDAATVSFKRHALCDKCKMCRVHSDGKHCMLDVKNDIGANKDDFVTVRVYKRSVRAKSLLLYLLPLALTALGVGLGTLMSIGASVILGVCGLVVGLAFAVPIDVLVIKKHDGFYPKTVSVCTEADFDKNAGKVLKDNT